MDEIPEYPRSVLEALRQPLEDKVISVVRAGGRNVYPADFMLIATMNPCPCGHLGDESKECSCTTIQIATYQKRLSGPLLDRIDLVIGVSRIPNDILLEKYKTQESQHNNALVLIQNARLAQQNRYKSSVIYNGSLSSRQVNELLVIEPDARVLLSAAGERLNLSARSYFKVIKVAQTIADLDGSQKIEKSHIAEALQYRGQST